MTDRLDDAILAAYVDGELSPNQLAEVEKGLIHDPQARRKVARMREVTALMRSTCTEERYQDVPDTLLQVLRRKPQAQRGCLCGCTMPRRRCSCCRSMQAPIS
jgi:anti-sigma factor RsiW